MGASPVFKPLSIESHKGTYKVLFDDNALDRLNSDIKEDSHVIIDSRVAGLYGAQLSRVINAGSVISIEASEINKSLHKFPEYVEHLVSKRVRRGQRLVAIGGGVIQDITCFLAATMLRGLPWHFYPTTLLAQADSCIGSKSSINVGRIKNILGTFTPPVEVYICTHVLKTLEEREMRSGIGEMLKVHAIEGPESFDSIAFDLGNILSNQSVTEKYIYRSLEIKKPIIELDEFDRGARNVMNYGHSFGHAIESATDFMIPHGIAVSMGMDMANFIAVHLDISDDIHYKRMHQILKSNAMNFEHIEIPEEEFISAIFKDKKHTETHLKFVLPDKDGKITVRSVSNDAKIRHLCIQYLKEGRFQ